MYIVIFAPLCKLMVRSSNRIQPIYLSWFAAYPAIPVAATVDRPNHILLRLAFT